MCILFSYISRRFNPNEFKLIILNNRDEYFHRESKPASIVTENTIYGMDLTPGKEGGTWIGANLTGKIASLLNLDRHKYCNDDDPTKLGRGFMVPNFLNTIENSFDYVQNIKENYDKYNPFNLVFFEQNPKNLWDVSVYNNFTNTYSKLDTEFFSISNHTFDAPYPKTVTGEKLFREIINDLNNTKRRKELEESIFEFAKYDAGKRFEDVVGHGPTAVREMMHEQVFIKSPNYGTRTHTLIMIDDNDKLTYHEKTMDFPINEDSPLWLKNEFEIHLKQNA